MWLVKLLNFMGASFRLAKLTSFYSGVESLVLKDLEENEKKNLSYDEWLNKTIQFRFGWSDYISYNLTLLGNEAIEIYGNYESLQKRWAKEKEIKYNQHSWFHEILIAQLRLFTPDIIFIEDFYVFTKEVRAYIREKCHSVKLITGFHSAEVQDYKNFQILILF